MSKTEKNPTPTLSYLSLCVKEEDQSLSGVCERHKHRHSDGIGRDRNGDRHTIPE